MSKKKRKRYRSKGKKYRRRRDRRIPLLPTAGFLGAQFSNLGIPAMAPSGPLGGLIGDLQNGMNPFDALKWLGRNELLMYTGVDIDRGSWNPLDARGSFIAVASVLASRFLGKYVNPTFSRIPLLGKYIKL